MEADTVTPCGGNLLIASWNVQGLSDVKLRGIFAIMKRRHIDILCMQETHITKSPYFSEDCFLVILSDTASAPREFAGVGFVIAPWVRPSLCGFLQFSNRLACLKLRVPKGRLALICAYAPHSGYAHDARQSFFEDLRKMSRRTSVYGLQLVFGDLNARIHKIQPLQTASFSMKQSSRLHSAWLAPLLCIKSHLLALRRLTLYWPEVRRWTRCWMCGVIGPKF